MTHTIVPHHYCSKHISQWIEFRIFVTTKGHISCISNRCILVQLCVFSLSLHRCCNSINLKPIWTLCPVPTKTYNDYIIIIQDTCNVKTQGKNSDIKTRTYQREKRNKKRIHSDTTTIQINVVGLWFLSANNVNTLPKFISQLFWCISPFDQKSLYVKQSLHEIVKKFVSYALHGSDVRFFDTVFLCFNNWFIPHRMDAKHTLTNANGCI